MILATPGLARRVLVDNPENYVRPRAAQRVLSPAIGGGLFLAEGMEWRRQRRLLAPTFAPRSSARLGAATARRTGALVERLSQLGDDLEVDLYPELQNLALTLAAETLFGIEIEPHLPAIRALTAPYLRRHTLPDVFDLLLPGGMPSPADAPRGLFRRRWRALVAGLAAERRGRPGLPADLFDLLERSEVDRASVEAQIATLLITGSETTGAALYWSIHLLAAHPSIQEAMAREVAAIDLAGDAEAGLAPLVLTRAVIEEALRLYPPAFSIVRQALQTEVVDGVSIPRGAIVEAAPWVLHRHRALWREPDRFDPDRFAPGAPAPPRGAYMPFGAGPRACIGAQFARLESLIALALIISAFEIRPSSSLAVRPVSRITLQPLNPFPFRLARRR